jgi:hypothetical protein
VDGSQTPVGLTHAVPFAAVHCTQLPFKEPCVSHAGLGLAHCGSPVHATHDPGLPLHTGLGFLHWLLAVHPTHVLVWTSHVAGEVQSAVVTHCTHSPVAVSQTEPLHWLLAVQWAHVLVAVLQIGAVAGQLAFPVHWTQVSVAGLQMSPLVHGAFAVQWTQAPAKESPVVSQTSPDGQAPGEHGTHVFEGPHAGVFPVQADVLVLVH